MAGKTPYVPLCFCLEVVIHDNAHMLTFSYIFVDLAIDLVEYQICPNFLVGPNYNSDLKLH